MGCNEYKYLKLCTTLIVHIKKLKLKDYDYMKFRKYLLLALLPFIFLLASCKQDEVLNASKNLTTYNIDITLNNNKTLNCKQTVNYRNNTGTTLDNIMFHLYPQSFRTGAKSSVVSSLNYKKCYYNGASAGGIEITSQKVNGADSEINICGNDQDIANVTLQKSLQPNDSVDIYFEYTVTIPNINHRFGYGDDTINIANFYPIACVYENGDFVIDSYHYNGDPFYSEVANYNVNLTADNSLVLATSGLINSKVKSESTTTYSMNALTIRDFAMVLSDKFKVVTDTIDGTTINYYYYNNKYPNEAIKASTDSVSTFNRIFGKYPYSTLSVVESDFVHGGMEYPNLVLISDMVDVQSDYINVIVHEIAHQWWYGIVGNNEYNYGWLDEGLTEYSTVLFYEENPSYNVNTKELIKNTTNSFVTFVDVYTKVFSKVDTTMNRKLDEYNNESEYVYIAYVKGMLIFDSMKDLLGKEKFLKCLQTYFNDNKFKIATPDNLIEAFNKSSKCNVRDIFESWINGKVKIVEVK